MTSIQHHNENNPRTWTTIKLLYLRPDNVTLDCLIHVYRLTKKSKQGDLSHIKHSPS